MSYIVDMPKKILFPSYIYQTKLEIPRLKKFNQDLAHECYQVQSLDEAGQKWSSEHYLGGYTSYGSLCRMYECSSTFDFLRKKINPHVKKFLNEMDYETKGKDIQMTDFWMNIMGPRTVHTMHIHPHSVISGTYYVQIPKGAGCIKFEDPRSNYFMATLAKKTNAPEKHQTFVNVQPQEGEIVLFESWMRHEVPPNASELDRISVSFNYGWF